MTISPSPDNYVLGKGTARFNKKDMTTGLYTGFRDMGNAPALAVTMDITKLPHYSSRSGLRSKDKEVISELTPGVSLTLDEVTDENLALLNMSGVTTVTQTAGYADAESITAFLGRRSELAYRNIGSYILTHGSITQVGDGVFTVGGTVTSDNVDPGTGTIIAVGTGQIVVLIVSGTFASGDTITDDDSDTATLSADPAWNSGVILVQDETDTTTYTSADYQVSSLLKDNIIGQVYFNESGGTVTDGETVHVSYNYGDSSYKEIQGFSETYIEGVFHFVSDNPVGGQEELMAWRVSFTPTGDSAKIGDDWSTLTLVGEILKDETNHPDNPYFSLKIPQ